MPTSVLFVITGASRGLGQAIAKVASQTVPNLRAILVARSERGLVETEEHMKRQRSHELQQQVSRYVMDLSDLDRLDTNLDGLFDELRLEDNHYDRVILINNAGTIGHLGSCLSSPSLADLRGHVDLNITSSLWLSVRFARFFRQQVRHASSSSSPSTHAQPIITIVNISSLVAIAEFPTMACYSAGKAAREKYHVIMAKELANDDDGNKIKILNYAPGPLETDMVTEIRAADRLDATLKPHFQKQLLHPDDSAKKLIQLLLSDNFESGAHIDYYDLPAS